MVVVDHLDKGANLGALGERLLVHLARDLRQGGTGGIGEERLRDGDRGRRENEGLLLCSRLTFLGYRSMPATTQCPNLCLPSL